MSAKIFRPSSNPMQSGKGKSNIWILAFEAETAREIEPLLGHASMNDMQSQVRMNFDSLEAAQAFAQKHGISYRVETPHEAKPKKVSYPDNFKHDRKTPWTH